MLLVSLLIIAPIHLSRLYATIETNTKTHTKPCNIKQGVKAVIAKSFERIHRSNLVGMGIVPLCFKSGEDADTLGLTGHERYTIDLPTKISDIRPGQDVTVRTDNGKQFTCTVRFDTEVNKSLIIVDTEQYFCGLSSRAYASSLSGGARVLQQWRHPSIRNSPADQAVRDHF